MGSQLVRQRGFTLIELMIVIATLGILIALALPAYQDYAIRARNSECLHLAAAPKTAIGESYQVGGNRWPASLASAGYTAAATSRCDAAGAYNANTGAFSIASTVPNGAVTFTFTPTTIENVAIEWHCSIAGGNNPAHVPAACR